MHRLAILSFAFAVLATKAGAQQLENTRSEPKAAPAMLARAVKVDRAPVIDGVARDAAWSVAPPVTGFREFDPVEGADPPMQTEARFAYDARNLYVLVRAFDPHPDSIMALLSRRDERTQSDYIRVVVDSYDDHRTGYEFMVNPAGVKRDIYLYNDSQEDVSWDAVWDVKTSIDSLGWVAEFRIPLSQLRYPRRDVHTFGVAVHREIARLNERSSWPLWRTSQPGIASQLGEVQGIAGIESPRRLEVLPYTVQSNESVERNAAFGRSQRGTVGADIKYGMSSNLTLDATVNPDFGQVEADPSVLNLTAFEQFYDERRPFFLEGTGILRFDQDCNDGQCTGLFYSRRIGRAPQLGSLASDASAVPTSSTILGAAKLTGRLPMGTSIGLLDAVTDRERVGEDLTVEPRTNYLVARFTQDLRKGQSGFGGILTAVHRDLDATTAPYLRQEAFTGGLDFRHRFGSNGIYQLSGSAVGSLVRGSAGAIAMTQRSAVHYFQRPDDGVGYDTTRTSLSGYAMNLGLSKNGGGVTRFWTGGWYKSPGLEINDVGFMTSVNGMGWSNWLGLVYQEPRAFYRRLQVNFNQWNNFLTDGTNTGIGGNVNVNTTLRNMWFVYGGVGMSRGAYCGSCLRGGPLLRTDASLNSWFGFSGDSRHAVVPGLNGGYNAGDGGRSWNWSVGPTVAVRVASNVSATLGVSYSRNVSDRQSLGNFGDIGADTTHYTVARLSQRTLSVTTRLNYTASPTLSFQFYGQPFVSAGGYTDWRQALHPHDADYAGRFTPYPDGGDPGGFNFKQFRSNAVIRWEYRPGSTLFVVWQQGREQSDRDLGQFGGLGDYANLFEAHPANTFLIKASYWFSM